MLTKTKQPVYQNMFEYMVEHYEFKAPDTPLTKFYKKDIYEYQYKNLNGPINPEKRNFKSKDEAAGMVNEFAKSAGANLVGFTDVKDSFIFDNFELDPSHKSRLNNLRSWLPPGNLIHVESSKFGRLRCQ